MLGHISSNLSISLFTYFDRFGLRFHFNLCIVICRCFTLSLRSPSTGSTSVVEFIVIDALHCPGFRRCTLSFFFQSSQLIEKFWGLVLPLDHALICLQICWWGRLA